MLKKKKRIPGKTTQECRGELRKKFKRKDLQIHKRRMKKNTRDKTK